MSKVLFEVTEDNLDTGMRGYPVGNCVTSSVDPQTGLHYAGRPVAELAHFSPEEMIYLLNYGKEGSASEVKVFAAELQKRATLDPKVVAAIENLPREGHPMKRFCVALLLAGSIEGKDDYAEDYLNLIAKLPHIAAVTINSHAGWGKTPEPKPELGYMENFAHLLQSPSALDVEVLRLFNILHYDHGGGNLSAFTGKAIASGLEDIYGAISGSMCALAGPRHGKANQDCLVFVQQILERADGQVTEEAIEKIVRDKLANKELIFGFGHAVLRVEDVRATIFYDYASTAFPDHPLVKTILMLRKAGPKVLSENPKISNPYPNVDAASGSLLTAAGFPYPEYYTVLFGLSRSVGIARQIVYERLEARGGKGLPIVRPKYFYKPMGE